jgi:Integrase core domain/Chromo (CHRromatin Organisation MOdifier) domain
VLKGKELDNTLHFIYYDPTNPGSFGGVNPLLTQVNRLLLESKRPRIRREVVEEWLSGSEAYTTHKPASDKIKRNPVKVNYVNELWEMDVIFYPDIASYNKGFAYVFAVLDTASRFLYVRFMKRKTCLECLDALKSVIEESGATPKLLMSDRGKEFACASFTEYLKEKNIHLYHKHSGDVKTSHLDRAVRTIQTRLHRLFDGLETRDLLTYLPKLVDSYNRSVNRSIGMTPAAAQVPGAWNPSIDQRQQQQFPDEKVKFNRGQYVRLLGQKQGHHAYKGDWTFEIFKVTKIKHQPGRRVQYYVTDLKGEPVLGAHYSEELQAVKKPDRSKQYKIERVLRYRTVKGKKQALVKWSKLDNSQNSWIPVKDLKDHGKPESG